MSTADYERYRRRLEEQLRADVQLLYQAYLSKLRAYETVSRTRGELDLEPLPASELTLSLPPMPGPAPRPAATASPAPPTPLPPRRAKALEVDDAASVIV
jgi:hypothetical protein